MESSSREKVNDNKCCVCFVLYEDDQSGKDWVACACGRWLHEDCADDCAIDSDGNERLCLMSESPVSFVTSHFFSPSYRIWFFV